MKSSTHHNLIVIALTIITLLLCISYSNYSVAATGDELIVIESLVNVRAEPSTDSESLIRLKEGRKVTEIQRQGNWVEIETHRQDIKTGWIYKTLLTRLKASQNTSSPTRFQRFMQRFNDHNDVIKKQNGVIYFSDVKNKGQGQIDIIVTEAWINCDNDLRNSLLGEIFNLWSEVVPVGSSISVRVFDKQGEQHTMMLR